MNISNLKEKYTCYILCVLLVTPHLNANDDYGVTEQKLSEIEARVNKMSIEQLNARRLVLLRAS